jgi:Nuclease-related domain
LAVSEPGGRNRVGAESERLVRRQLDRLRRDGWEVRHGVGWPGGGDIDHLVRSPSGVGFVVETKTRRFEETHLRRTARAAGWAGGKRRRYPLGVVPVLCVVHSRNLEQCYGEVLVVSVDRLLPALQSQGGWAVHEEPERLGGRVADGGRW